MGEAEAPVFIVAAAEIEIDERARAFRRHAEGIARIARPEEAHDSLECVAVLAVFLAEGDDLVLVEVAVAIDIVEFDKLAGEAHAEASERLPRGPELDRIGKGDVGAGADDIVLVIPPLAAVALDGQLEEAVEEVRLRDARFVGLDARACLRIHAPLLAGAAEVFRGREQIEIGLRKLCGDEDGIDAGSADADHERAGVLLLDLVNEIAVFAAFGILALAGVAQVVAHAGEVVEILQLALRAFRAVFEHPVAGRKLDFAADNLVLGVVVALDLDFVDHDRDALGDLEDNIERGGIGLRGNALDIDAGIGEPEVSGADGDHDAMGGVVQRLLAGDRAGRGNIALACDDRLRVAREAGYLR